MKPLTTRSRNSPKITKSATLTIHSIHQRSASKLLMAVLVEKRRHLWKLRSILESYWQTSFLKLEKATLKSPGRRTELSTSNPNPRQGTPTSSKSCSTRTNRIWWTSKVTKARRIWPQSLAEEKSWELRKTHRSIQANMLRVRNLTSSIPSRLKSWLTSKL